MIDLESFDPDWLAAEQAMGGRMVLPAEPVSDARNRFAALFTSIEPLLPSPTAAVTTTDLVVPSSSQRLRLYLPSSDSTSTLRSVGLYIHSGGWYSGSLEHEDFLARRIALEADMIIYSCDYRLAPESPYPAALEDVCAAWEYMYSTARKHGGDNERKVVMGGSAGGNLAAAVALKYANRDAEAGGLKAQGLCCFVPATCEPSALPAEYLKQYTPERYTDAPMIGLDILRQAREWYAAPATDPLYSILLHPSIAQLPRTYIAACTKDPTHQETHFFYDTCVRHGVDVELVEWRGMPHFFWVLPMLSKSEEFLRLWVDRLRSMVHGEKNEAPSTAA